MAEPPTAPLAWPGSPNWRPVPDPTELTTQAVALATAQYRREMNSLRELIEARINGMDRASDLLASSLKETVQANAAQTLASATSQAAVISDLKDRVVRLETAGPAKLEARTEQRADRGVNMASIMAVITAISVLAAVAFGVIAAIKK